MNISGRSSSSEYHKAKTRRVPSDAAEPQRPVLTNGHGHPSSCQKIPKLVLEKLDYYKGEQKKQVVEVSRMAEANRSVIARTSQLKLLKALLKGPSLPRAMFLWGAPSTGKSFTLETALKGEDIHVIRIHALEILCGRRAFYETIVKQLVSRSKMKLAENFKCDSLQSLYSNVEGYFAEEGLEKLRVVSIVEGVENLKGEYNDIIQFLVSLQDITQCCICVAFISVLPPGQFMPYILDHAIIPVYFPQYTDAELKSILIAENIPRSVNGGAGRSNGYEFFITMLVSVFYVICRDLRKLTRLAKSHWESFQKMMESSQEVNLGKLWRQLEPQLKAQFYELNAVITSANVADKQVEQDRLQNGKSLAMPLNAKYLLIASYLATHNPPSSDKRFFVKSKASNAKKRRTNLKTDTSANDCFRSFELNRLSAIFGSIQSYCDDSTVNKNRNISFMTLLTTLCQNKLIQHLGEDSCGNQKYKCLLDYDTVLEMSKSVNFELNNYLFHLL